MRGASMAEKIHTTVPGSLFEYRVTLEEPLLNVCNRSGEILQAVYVAFKPWKVELSQLSSRQFPNNFGETQYTFEVIAQRVYFHIFLGSAVLAMSNPTWADAELIQKVGEAGL